MEPNHPTLRAKRFDVTEKARMVASLEAMVTDFEHIALELTRQISCEEERTHIKDPAHVAYSTLAKATTLRRTKLLSSAADLRAKLDIARCELEEAEAELRALELAETRDANRQLRKVDITLADASPN
jgi:flagellar FliJ protein